MNRSDEAERRALVADRHEFLERLAEAPAYKPTLVEQLDTSRSTVDRAIRELTEAGFVERVDEGFRTTAFGRLLADRYRAFVEDQRAVLSAEGALAPLDPDADLPPSLLSTGEVVTADGQPYGLYDRVLSAIRTADAVDALLPRVGDTRPLRLCRTRLLDDDLDGGFVVAPGVDRRLREEFPAMAADLGDADSFELRRGEVPEFELYVTSSGADRSAFVVTAADGDAVGLIRSDADPVLDWADGLLASVGASADLTNPAQAVAGATETPGLGSRDDRIGAEGFAVLDEASLAEQTPTDPVAAWRTGHDVADVYYGNAFERRTRTDGELGRPVATELADRLASDGHHVLVGPPGDGKSTTCRAVACRWITRDAGPVFYRRSRARQSFDSPVRLADAVSRADGHALVVVEDVTGETGRAALELCERLPDDAEVTVLVEARHRTWDRLGDRLSDATLLQTRQSALSTYRLPELDETACERAIDAFEVATGRSVSMPADELRDRVRDGSGGGMYLLGHHLLAHTGDAPWRRDGPTPTGLDADVRTTHDALVDADEEWPDALALETGLLVATLVAADHPVTEAHAHVVAAASVRAESSGTDVADAHRRVADALDRLDGRLLFDADDGFRTQHPFWAVRFLETALDRDRGETVAAFGRGLSALFEAVDDAEVRDRVGRWLGTDASELDALAADPDEVVRSVFELASERSELVELLGDGDGSRVDPPDGCSAETRLVALREQMLGWYDHGELDTALAVSERLADRAQAADLDPDASDRFVARSHRNRGEVAEERGDADLARDHFERSLELAERADDDRSVIASHNALAWIDIKTDSYDDAGRHLDAAVELGADRPPTTTYATTLYYRGELARHRGDLGEAERWLGETVALDRELGNDRAVGNTLNALGIVAEERDAVDRAEDYYRRSIAVKRETEDRAGLAKAVYNLGDLLVQRGDLDDAEESLNRSLELADEVGMDRFQGNVFGGLGRLALAREEVDRAEEFFRRQRERHRDHDYEYGAALALSKLGDAARERGDVPVAVDRYDRAADALGDIGATRKATDALARAAEVLDDTNRPAEAADRYDRAADLADAAELPDRAESLRERRGELEAGEA